MLPTLFLAPVAGRAAAAPAYVTRAQFAVRLAQALHLQPADGARQVFSDLPPGNPDFPLLMAAYDAGWISGFPNRTFRPNAPLTREQVAKCEVLALGLGAEAQALQDRRPAYGDWGLIGNWAWGYVDEAKAIGVLEGFSLGDFRPQETFTPAQSSHLEAQLTRYLATAPAPRFQAAPHASVGTALGTTEVSAAPNAPADTIALEVSPSPFARPTWLSPAPQGATPYSPDQNLLGAPGLYVGVFEVTTGGIVTAFSQLRLTAADVLGPPAGLRLEGPASGSAQSEAGIGPFTVALVDAGGHPATAPAAGVTVELTSNAPGTHAFAASPSGPPTGEVTIAPGETTASFYYGDEQAGRPVLLATSPGLGSASLALQIAGGPAAGVRISGPAKGLTSGQALTGPFMLGLVDAFGNPALAPAGGLMVSLASSSAGSVHFSASPGGLALSSIEIPAGQGSATFYYGDSSAGSPTISAEAAGLAPTTFRLRLISSSPAGLEMTGPTTTSATAVTGPFTVTLTNAAGEAVPSPAGGTALSLDSTSPGPHAFAASRTGARTLSVRIPAGSTSVRFFYRDTVSGIPTISATAAGLRTATRQVAVAGAVPLAGRGLDSATSQATPQQVQAWYQEGMRNIFLNTFAPEFARQYAASLHLMHVVLFQGYWTPAYTDETGAARAQSAIAAARSVGYPSGADLFLDIESTGGASAQHMVVWIDSWSTAVERAGYGAGVYFGVPQPVTASEAYHTLAARFWKSYSGSSITPAVRGVCVVQTDILGTMDTDWFGVDRLGERCIGAGA